MTAIRRLAQALLVLVAATIAFALGMSGASASTPADRPVVGASEVSWYAEGGVDPATWHTHINVKVTGFNFTPGGDVYVDYQDITAMSGYMNASWIKAGTAICGAECTNYGKIYTTANLQFAYGVPCGHVIRVWAWDKVKSPQAGYGWITSDFTAKC